MPAACLPRQANNLLYLNELVCFIFVRTKPGSSNVLIFCRKYLPFYGSGPIFQMRASPCLSWDRTGLKGKVPEAKSGLRRLPRQPERGRKAGSASLQIRFLFFQRVQILRGSCELCWNRGAICCIRRVHTQISQ